MATVPSPSEAADSVEERADEWVEILQRLVQTPSENPPGDTTDVASYFTGLLDDRGVNYEIIAPVETMPNVVASFEGDGGDGPHLVFNGHLDTFPLTGEGLWEYDPFGGEIVDGRIYGKGVADMHAGFVASLAAFLYLFEHQADLPGRVTLAAVSDEETGGRWGTEYLVDNYPEYNGDAVLNGEPSSNGIIRFGERGPIWLEVHVRGRPAHITTLSEKVSAVDILSDIIVAINEDDGLARAVEVPPQISERIIDAKDAMDDAFGEGATERLLNPDINVGTIEGGEKPNLIAERAEATVDIRMPVGNETAMAKQWLKELVDGFPGSIEVETRMAQEPTFSDVEHPIFRHLREAATTQRDGTPPEYSCAMGGTDCRFYRPLDIPCAIYGPTPHNIGAENEFVFVDDFLDIVAAQTGAAIGYLTDPAGETVTR